MIKFKGINCTTSTQVIIKTVRDFCNYIAFQWHYTFEMIMVRIFASNFTENTMIYVFWLIKSRYTFKEMLNIEKVRAFEVNFEID